MAEAAAGVVGLAQFGFSLATTLITYVGDFRDASDDITGLANEITATYRQVGELKSLLDKNKTSQSLSDSVRLEAEDCQLKAEKLATRLWKQLGKSHADISKGRLIGSEDIEVSVFSRARWPIYKPRLDQHKQELMVLKQNIMMVFAMARMNNYHRSDAIDRLRTQEQIDKLKKGKELALEALRDATRRRKQARGRNRHQKRQRFVDTASRSRRSFAATDPDSTSYAYSVQTDFETPERGPSYDSYGTVDEDGFDEAMSKAAELVHAGVLAQIEEEEEALRLDAAARQQRDAQIVSEYKAKLLFDLEKSHRDLEEMKTKLRKAFGSAVNEEQIERYVAARKEEALRGEEVAKLLEELTDARTADAESASHQAEVGTLLRSSRSRFKFTNLFHRHRPRRTQRTLQFSSRRNSVSSENTSSDTSATTKASIEIQGTNFHCVVVSIDAHNRTISRIRLPTAWLIVLLSRQKALQGIKRWYREAKHFKRTLATYAQLDFASRRQTEAPQVDETFQPQDLELLYARKLDEKRSKTRRMLDSALLVAEPWDFHRGRVLLVYKINESSGNGHSDMRVSPNGPHRPPPYINGPHNYHGPLNGGYNTRYVVKERVKTSFEDDRSQPWKPGQIGRRPVYPSTHRDFLSLDTLAYYDIPYEIDRSDPDYIIILREMDKYETEVLFEHTRRLRGGSARRRTSFEDMRDHSLRSEIRDEASPVDVKTYRRGTSSGYDDVGARTRDRSSGYQQSFSSPYQPGTSGLYRSKSPYAPPVPAPAPVVYTDYDYDGLHAHRSMSKRRSRSPSAYIDGRRSRTYSQRSYGANDVDTEVESAFPDKQLIVKERGPAERWNPRQFSRDEGHDLPVVIEMYVDKDKRSRNLEAEEKEEKEIEERRHKTEVEADVLRTIKDFKERESSFKGDTKVTAKRLAALAMRSRSRSRSRSKAPSISSASVAERRSLQSPTKSTRMPMRSAQTHTRTARSQPQTFEHNSIDAVVQRRKWQDSENSPYKYGTELAGGRDNSRFRRGVRSSTLDTLPGRSILKTGENNRSGEEVSEDSISDVFTDSEDSEDSSTESSESDGESDPPHRRAASGGPSELGLDRTMTDSPVSISSRDSHQNEYLVAASLPASRSGPGNLRRMTGSVSSSSARGPVFGADGEHVNDRAEN